MVAFLKSPLLAASLTAPGQRGTITASVSPKTKEAMRGCEARAHVRHARYARKFIPAAVPVAFSSAAAERTEAPTTTALGVTLAGFHAR
jgi:hypothetical protein